MRTLQCRAGVADAPAAAGAALPGRDTVNLSRALHRKIATPRGRLVFLRTTPQAARPDRVAAGGKSGRGILP